MEAQDPKDFLAKLTAEDLPGPRDVAVVGMAKASEGSSSVIDFTTSTACRRWLSLPIEIVESVTHLANMPCKDHEHPVVKVTFKRRDGEKDDVAFLLDLVSELRTALSRAKSGAVPRRPGGDVARDGPPPVCTIVDMPGGLEICCSTIDRDGFLDIECGGIV